MKSPDERLASLFAADLPPRRDPGFQAEVLAAVARREFLGDVMALGTLTAVAVAMICVLWPALSPTMSVVARELGPGLVCPAVAASVAVMGRARFLSPGS